MRYGFEYVEKRNLISFHCVSGDMEDFGEHANVFKRYPAPASWEQIVEGWDWGQIAQDAQKLFSEHVDREVASLVGLLSELCILKTVGLISDKDLRNRLQQKYGKHLTDRLDIREGRKSVWKNSKHYLNTMREIRSELEAEGVKVTQPECARRIAIKMMLIDEIDESQIRQWNRKHKLNWEKFKTGEN